MHNVRNVTEDIVWVGCNDRRLALFENLFPVPGGVSYNSYLILDEKVVLMDTVDKSAANQFFENLEYALKGRKIDYLVIQHMEPDHSASIAEVMNRYPEMKIVANAKAVQMMSQFFEAPAADRLVLVKEGDTLSAGKHVLHFAMAPMVHWPEVMVTYEETEKILFSADAFGTFGALNGNIFNDEIRFESEWLPQARRYYANIVGKYGVQVQALLKKAAAWEIQMICPLHGPVWREHVEYFIEKYDKWSRYEPEDREVAIIYGSIYGHTEQAVNALAVKLAEKGIKNISVYDVSTVEVSELIAEIFRVSHLVFACSTYNGGIYPPMENLLTDMKALSVQNRTAAVMDNGTWAPVAGKHMITKLQEMKNMKILDLQLSVKSVLGSDREEELDAFAKQIADTI